VNHELIYLSRHSRENGNPASFKYEYRVDARQKNSGMTVTLNMNHYMKRFIFLQYSISFDEKISTFKYTTKGLFDTRVDESALSALVSHPHWKKGCKPLVDHSNTSTNRLTFKDISHVAELGAKYFAKQPPSVIAILVEGTEANGLATCWETVFSGLSSPKTGIFTDLHLAEDFLLKVK